MDYKTSTADFRNASKTVNAHQKALRLLKKEINALKRSRLAEQKKSLAEVKKAREVALANLQDRSFKSIRLLARQQNAAIRQATAADIQALTQRLLAAIPRQD